MSINKKSVLKNAIVCVALLVSMQSVFAQTGTVVIPATEIMSAPLGTGGSYNSAANKKMLFAFLVQGTGTISPAYGQIDQVIVTYQF